MEQVDISMRPSMISEVVGDATSVLLTGPTSDDRVTAASLSFLSSPDPTMNHVHWATMLRSPADVIRLWSDHVGEPPASLSLVEIGEPRRRSGTAPCIEGFTYSTTQVESPSNLTRLGVTLVEATEVPADGQHRLWVESLSTLLQYVPVSAAFQFVHALHQRFVGTTSSVCYHLDPALHETRTLHVLLSACDAWVHVDSDEVTVKRR